MNTGAAAADWLREAQAKHQAYKSYFIDFLESGTFVATGNYYKDKIRRMVSSGGQRLIVNINDLRAFDAEQPPNQRHHYKLLKDPIPYIAAFEEALRDFIYKQPDITERLDEYLIGFEGSFGAHLVTPRGLKTDYLKCLVCVEGIVTKLSLVRPKLITSVHYSEGLKGGKGPRRIIRHHRDATSTVGLPTAPVYPTRDEDDNVLSTEYGLSVYRDFQTLVVQEMPEKAPPGQLPRSVEVIIENDLVDLVKPGDRVQVVGVYRALPNSSGGGGHARGIFRTALIANNIQLLSKEIQGPQVTPEDIQNIKALAQNPQCFDILAQSLAPSIYGHVYIKKAMLLQLLGGLEKELSTSGIHLRGDINILMVGDPGTAKSQLLRFVLHVAPLAISTSGRGSTGVGLTAAVVQDHDTGDRRLEAGAMVLADRGIVCIDEFDKMSAEDRVAIHEVMEQQTVTISKAGIHASLNARCSVLAAANPIYGKYDRDLPAAKNISMPDSLLSRFDLLFIVLDQLDPVYDRNVAEHVLRMHRYQATDADDRHAEDTTLEEGDPMNKTSPVFLQFNRLLHGNDKSRLICTIPFIKKYLLYAKKMVKPVLNEAATKRIIDAYDELRKREDTKTLPVTARTLETMIRLATAHAKCRLSNEVIEEDADVALDIMRFALYNDTKSTSGDLLPHSGMIEEYNEENDKGDYDDEVESQNSMEVEESNQSISTPVASAKRRRSTYEGRDESISETRQSKRPRVAGDSQPTQESVNEEEEASFQASPSTAQSQSQGKSTQSRSTQPRVDAKKAKLFESLLLDVFDDADSPSVPLEDIVTSVNKNKQGVKFTEREVIYLLEKMSDEGKIFYTEGVAHRL